MTHVEAPDAETTRQILAAEHARSTALVDGDVAALDELFEESLVHIHAPGLTQDKFQLLEHVATRRAYQSITRGELLIRQIGDVAIMTGQLVNRLRNPDGSERTVDGVATQVLHRGVDGRWRFVSFQMTPIGAQVWPALPSEGGDEKTTPIEASAKPETERS
ncbi:nuclear transport factor 2 family protein [Agromyces sp. Soil535]|uniref:nuclear transport factor 2 family protein n=1 Tax=Agromyces sp. Soil535 TaxID=1736390 RepID=UPI0006F8E541|nr:nuclear transport factor 2 family protein [Agromyces sp. Soil535]KRE23300.1 hypothetical protein ASG80_06105 [Agromyces sp. Soil535]